LRTAEAITSFRYEDWSRAWPFVIDDALVGATDEQSQESESCALDYAEIISLFILQRMTLAPVRPEATCAPKYQQGCEEKHDWKIQHLVAS
jgi:hypothetical protein